MQSSGEALAAWRQREGLTVRDLAYAAEVDASTVARMEAGDFAVAALPKTRAKVWRKAGMLVRAAATSNVPAPGWHDVRELDVVRGGELQVRPTSDGHEEYTT